MNCTFGVSGTALSYHQSRSPRFYINGIVSEQFKLDQFVPQSSCRWIHRSSSPVFSIIDQHGKLGHAYADDHQFYCSFHPYFMDSKCESMERWCISNFNTWMQGMKLKFNHSMTEYILIGTPQQLAKWEIGHLEWTATKLWNTLTKDVPSYNDVGVLKSKLDSKFWCSLQLSYGCTFY